MSLKTAAFDHHSPELTEPRVWRAYDEAREQSPVVRTEANGGYWLVSGYTAVKTALRDAETFSSAQGVRVPAVGAGRSIPIDFDPPLHTEYRALMMQALTPDRVREMKPFLEELVPGLLRDFAAKGGGDFVADVALPLPLRVLSEVVGFSNETVSRLHELTKNQWELVATVSLDEARVHLRALMEEEMKRHREENPDDFLSWLLQQSVAGRPITDDEVARVLLTLAIAGHETTANASANLVHTLATQRHLQEQLKADPSRAAEFVEELLRYRTPAHNFGRTATKDVELAGTAIGAGDSVLLSFAAANRDGNQFERPDEFDIDRGARGHLAFGWGIHQCMGSALARSELKLLLETLAELPYFEPASPATFRALDGGIHFGPSALPIRFLTEEGAHA
jgi:cytochrome P450